MRPVRQGRLICLINVPLYCYNSKEVSNIFVSDLNTIGRTISISIMLYFALIIILKLSGKRTLSNINAFDLLVTVAIGAISATTILSKDTSLFDGLVAIITLIVLQYIIAKLDTKYSFIGKIFISTPTLLYYKGEFLVKNMKKMRITKHDVRQQVRLKSGTVIENVSAVLLEVSGEFSVITDQNDKNIKKLEKYK